MPPCYASMGHLVKRYMGHYTSRTLVWAIPASGAVAFTVVPLGEKSIDAAVVKLRAALDPGATILGEIPAFDVGTAHELYRALLEPVAAGWRQAESLLVVPHGP